MLVLVIHHLTEGLLDFTGGNLFTVGVFKAFGEEVLEREYSKVGLYPLAVHNAGYCGDIKAGALCYVLENHGLEGALVSVYEVIVLVLQYGPHGAFQSVLPLAEGLDEPLGGIYLLLHERCRFFIGLGLRVLPRFHYLGVLPVHAKLRDVEARHGEDELSVLIFQHEVRDHLLGLIGVRIVYLAAGGRVEPLYLIKHGLHLFFREVETAHDLLEMAVLEGLKLVPEHPQGVIHGRSALLVLKLDYKALPEVSRPNAGGLELLDHLQHLLHFIGR